MLLGALVCNFYGFFYFSHYLEKFGLQEQRNILPWDHETKKYLEVYKKFLHTSLASELEYKTNILIDLFTAILSLMGSIFLLSIFFQNNGYIGGWEFKQALIIQGIYTILN